MSETNTISPLSQRIIEDMAARKLNPHTQRGHIYSCKRFAAWLKRSPDTVTPDDVRGFQLYLIESGTSICNRNRLFERRLAERAECLVIAGVQKPAQMSSKAKLWLLIGKDLAMSLISHFFGSRLGHYVLAVLVTWILIFAIGFFSYGPTPGRPALHAFAGFLPGVLAMYFATRLYGTPQNSISHFFGSRFDIYVIGVFLSLGYCCSLSGITSTARRVAIRLCKFSEAFSPGGWPCTSRHMSVVCRKTARIPADGVVAYDIFFDMGATVQRYVPRAAFWLHDHGFAAVVDVIIRVKAAMLPGFAWAISNGMWALGTKHPLQTVAALQKYALAGVAQRIKGDVLILAGAEDHFAPKGQVPQFEKALTSARSVTTKIYDRASGGAEHCQFGAQILWRADFFDWIAEKFSHR